MENFEFLLWIESKYPPDRVSKCCLNISFSLNLNERLQTSMLLTLRHSYDKTL